MKSMQHCAKKKKSVYRIVSPEIPTKLDFEFGLTFMVPSLGVD